MEQSNTDALKRLVEQYQCPGCIAGCDLDCGQFKFEEQPDAPGYAFNSCQGHSPGTVLMGMSGTIKKYLGLPRGMNTVGDGEGKNRIRLWAKGTKPEWDVFNIPIWFKMDEDNLIVKTVLPRRMEIWIDVIEEGDPSMLKDICAKGFAIGELESDFNFTPFDVTPHEDID